MNEDMEKMLQEAPAPTLTLEPFAEEYRKGTSESGFC